jgi:hypothetical protein
LIDSLPASVGGLPDKTPERPATPPAYPAVHDLPPARADVPLSEAEKKKLREDLAATRERAARQGGKSDVITVTGSTQSAGAARNP